MKKNSLALILSCTVCAASAQIPQEKDIESRVTKLEQLVQLQNQNILEIQSQFSEVLAQNLALKNALHLQPTIVEGTNSEGINFRLISANGDKKTGDVVLAFEALNTIRKDIDFTIGRNIIEIIDENGIIYDIDYYTVGNIKNSFGVKLHPDTPVEFKFFIKGYGKASYIKILDVGYNFKPYFRFQNIPIKWE